MQIQQISLSPFYSDNHNYMQKDKYMHTHNTNTVTQDFIALRIWHMAKRSSIKAEPSIAMITIGKIVQSDIFIANNITVFNLREKIVCTLHLASCATVAC